MTRHHDRPSAVSSLLRLLRPIPLGVAALVALAQLARGQTAALAAPTCRQTLDSLDAKVRRNYAGYQLEVRGPRQQQYTNMRSAISQRADTTALSRCYPALAAYISWYQDPHLFVFQSQAFDSVDGPRRMASLRHLVLSEADIRTSLIRRSGKLDPIEGIWFEGALRIAVVPDPEGDRRAFVGVVLSSDTVTWPVGAVRARFHRAPDGSYATILLTRTFAAMELTGRIHKRMLLRLSPGEWGREFPVAPADTGLIDPVDVHRPVVSVRPNSVLFSLPSNDPQYLGLLDSLVAVHAATIASKALLIVDLRGNEGGASFMARALFPYVSTKQVRPTPFDSGAAVMLSSAAQIAYARRFTGNDTSAFVRSLVSRLEAHPDSLVPIEEAPSPASPPDSVIDGPWRVIVMVDHGTVSAAEVLVLGALRSTRALVVGTPTAGALDYQSVQIISLGTGYRRWALGYPTIAAHADLPRRGMRGSGIQPDVKINWDKVKDPIAEVERRFVR